jgi:SNF2 family DNA or RNA helicase
LNELLQFQAEGVEFLLNRKKGILNDQQGLGKTVQAVVAASTLQGPKLIIANSVSRVQWRNEIHKWDSPNVPVVFAGKAGAFDQEGVQSWFRQPLTNAYLITYHPSIMYSYKALKGVGTWQAIIVDEGHNYRNRKSKRTKALKRLQTVCRWMLTGTSFDKSPAELWSLLNWLDPKRFNAYWPFVREHIEVGVKWIGLKETVPDVRGLKDPKSFAKVISPYILRRTKEQVAPQLPPKLYQNIVVPMGDRQRVLYETIRKETIVTLSQGDLDSALFIRNALARMSKLTRCALDPGLIDVNHKWDEAPKVDWITNFKRSHSTQFVIFTGSKDFALSLPMLIDGGVCITGDDKPIARDKKLAKFKKGKARYIVGTIQLIAESIDLPHAGASIFADLPLSSIKYEQAEERIHRLTTTESPIIYRLLAERSIDSTSLARLEGKLSDRRAVEVLLGGHDYG